LRRRANWKRSSKRLPTNWTATATVQSKAEALRLLVRVALGEVAPETLEAGAKGYQQFRESQDYEF